MNPLLSLTGQRPENVEYDENLFNDLKNIYIEKELRRREEEFIAFKSLKIFIGTWNVNGATPPDQLSKWLCWDFPDGNPDIVAIAYNFFLSYIYIYIYFYFFFFFIFFFFFWGR